MPKMLKGKLMMMTFIIHKEKILQKRSKYVFEIYEQDEQEDEEYIEVGRPQNRPTLDDQPKSSYRRSPCFSQAPKWYGTWFLFDQVNVKAGVEDVFFEDYANALIT